ncbi:hypothetical protein ACW5WQ_04315 [Aeromonas rivuli]|jgi:hypothetical protein|uniref:hypothetical protein n=1 Tax=Aeromonas rivuli TaxID=648794 RepID=UPI000A6BEEAD|nr:hypothetical protein [Aeromonas rivuli]
MLWRAIAGWRLADETDPDCWWCGHGGCRLLSQHDVKVKKLSGGFKTWQVASLRDPS